MEVVLMVLLQEGRHDESWVLGCIARVKSAHAQPWGLQ